MHTMGWALLEKKLKRDVTQRILLNITPPEMYHRDEDYVRLGELLPYAKEYVSFRLFCHQKERDRHEVVPGVVYRNKQEKMSP